MDKEDGMISISMLIVLSLMAVFSLYIYRLSLTENDSLEILKMNMQTKNYTISESLNLIDIYKYDKENKEITMATDTPNKSIEYYNSYKAKTNDLERKQPKGPKM